MMLSTEIRQLREVHYAVPLCHVDRFEGERCSSNPMATPQLEERKRAAAAGFLHLRRIRRRTGIGVGFCTSKYRHAKSLRSNTSRSHEIRAAYHSVLLIFVLNNVITLFSYARR